MQQQSQSSASSVKQPLVGIVIPSYCSYSDLQRCLPSLNEGVYRAFFVVIVDNASPDGTGERLLHEHKDSAVNVICSPENRGFAAAANIGICWSLKHGADYVWLLNPDTEAEPEALAALVEAARAAGSPGAWGSKILYGEDKGRGVAKIWGAGGAIDRENFQICMRGNGQIDDSRFDKIQDADYLPGCSILASKEVFQKAGYLPEDYFMYWEETDWCMRLSVRNFVRRCVPRSVVWHHFSDQKMQDAFTVYYYNRNERFFWQRWGGRNKTAKLFVKALFRELPRALRAAAAAPGEEQKMVFRAHAAAAVDFLLQRRGRRRSWARTAPK